MLRHDIVNNVMLTNKTIRNNDIETAQTESQYDAILNQARGSITAYCDLKIYVKIREIRAAEANY